MTVFPTPVRAALAVAAAALLAPAAASAATVTYEGDVLVYRAAPGERNNVGVQSGDVPEWVTIYDASAGVTGEVPAACEDHRDYHSLYCTTPAGGVRLELGDGADWGTVSSDVAASVTMRGGAGDDRLEGNDAVNRLFGEDGADRLEAYGGDDELDGGEGADTLDGYSGRDRLLGGPGDDLLHPDSYEAASADVVDGGPGVDRIESDYSTRLLDDPEPLLAFTLGGGADDGRPGEGDDIRGVERLMLSKGATVVGTDAAEYVKLHQVGDDGDLAGLGGADELRGGDGSDRIDGGAGDDLLDGGYGDDTITGGPGRDRISADLATGDCGPYWCKYPYGNDVVQARDGEIDSVTCGAGTDRVVADAADTVAPDCETVERPGPVPGGGGGGGGGGTPGPGPDRPCGCTPAPDPGPGPGPVVGPAAAPRLSVVAGQRLTQALRSGLRVKVTGDRAGARTTVRALHAGRVVAVGGARPGQTATLRFTAAARRALARRASVRLTVAAAGARAPRLTVLLRR